MRKFLVLFSVFTIFTLHAQDSLSQKKPCSIFCRNHVRPVRDTITAAGPNEIYVNVSPMFAILLGGFPSNEANFSLFYKRRLENPRLALRTGLSLKPQTSDYYFTNYNDWYFDETDTSRTINRFQRGNATKYQLNIGLEYRTKGKGRWGAFAGIDLIAGYYRENYVLYDIHERRDSFGNWGFSEFVPLDYKTTHDFYAGLSPKVGLRYAFNSHWMMGVQSGMDFVFTTKDYYSRNAMGTQIVRHPSSVFEVTLNSLIEEFSVAYRF